jgi:hypothetical protein
MKLEKRELPPFMVYLTARLTGRPLHTILWLIAQLLVFVLILMLESNLEGSHSAIAKGLAWWLILLMLILLTVLVSTAIRKEGRHWLLAKYDNGDGKPVGAGSRVVVRCLPLFGLIVILEYWLTR